MAAQVACSFHPKGLLLFSPLPNALPGLLLEPQAVDIMVALTGSEDVPVKKLLLWLEMARQELPDPAGKIDLQAWTKVLQNLSTGHSSSSGFSKSRFAM
jgi:hypothetical protein